MEKTFQLNQQEGTFLEKLDQERTQALAAVGALSLDMETARKNLDSVAERHRAFIRHALAGRGVERYENAHALNGALIVSLPAPTAADVLGDGRPNGAAHLGDANHFAKE